MITIVHMALFFQFQKFFFCHHKKKLYERYGIAEGGISVFLFLALLVFVVLVDKVVLLRAKKRGIEA